MSRILLEKFVGFARLVLSIIRERGQQRIKAFIAA